ncbi:MAG: phage minor head protein [Dehalococcoidia bacterium]|nr:phage minor head protein [Dehalococcoidia bacterium]
MATINDANDWAVAIHVLSQTGEMPALYRTPKKLTKIERAFVKELRKVLLGLGVKTIADLEKMDRVMSPDNLFGSVEADIMSRATNLYDAYRSNVGLGMEFGYLRGGREVKEMIGIALSWDLQNPNVKRILDEWSLVASEKTMSRMKGDIKKIIQKGYEKGLGTDDLAEQLSNKFYDMSHQEAEFIARTEIGSAQNKGAMMSYEEAGIEKVQWLAAMDDRTRESHRAEHGKIVRRGERFPQTGLMYPGDKSGDISEWIACRCALTAVVKTNRVV